MGDLLIESAAVAHRNTWNREGEVNHWRRTCVAREAGHCVADKLRTNVCREVVALTTCC